MFFQRLPIMYVVDSVVDNIVFDCVYALVGKTIEDSIIHCVFCDAIIRFNS